MALDALDVVDDRLQNAGHKLMHGFRIVALDEVRRPAAAAQELLQLFTLDARQYRGIADLVAVEMKDRQHRAVADRIEEFVGLPCRRQRTCFGLAISNDAGDDQLGIVECRAECVAERISQLPALMNRAGGRRRNMARNAAGKRELREELLQARFVLADVGIDLAVAAFQIGVPHQRGTAMTGPGNVEHVQVVLLDDPVQMHIDEILAWCRAPMPNHKRLDVR